MPHKWLDKEKTQISYKPDSKPGIIWAQKLGDPECPYLKRWVLNFGKFAIRLHHWMGSDDPRTLHDHAWGFWTFILKGGYTDIAECDHCYGKTKPGFYFICQKCGSTGVVGEHLGRFSLTYREAHHKHTVQTDPGGAWTLLLNGPHIRKWGFYPDGKFMKVREYFRRFGHHPCIDEVPDA
jgi:hypothetical protein